MLCYPKFQTLFYFSFNCLDDLVEIILLIIIIAVCSFLHIPAFYILLLIIYIMIYYLIWDFQSIFITKLIIFTFIINWSQIQILLCDKLVLQIQLLMVIILIVRQLSIFAFFNLINFTLSDPLILQRSLRNIWRLYLLLVKFYIIVTDFRQKVSFSVFC